MRRRFIGDRHIRLVTYLDLPSWRGAVILHEFPDE
jgi:hypothetical protein